MAAISPTISSSDHLTHLRPFDVRRDLTHVADLIELCFADTLDADGRNYIQRMRDSARSAAWLHWAARATEIGSVPLAGYVWLEEGRLVGNASLIPYYIKGRRHYLIANVAVHPEYRRRGIGRHLTERSIQHALQRKAPAIWLHVREENEAAINLYQNLGFIERARRSTWHKLDEGAPAVLPEGFQLIDLRPHHWGQLATWLDQYYPPELSWHMPYKRYLLRPDILGMLARFLWNAEIHLVGLARGKQFLAAIAWQSTLAHTSLLWLAAAPEIEPATMHAFLWQARMRLPSYGGMVLEIPAHEYDTAIESAGFEAQQTLIWMEMKLDD